MPTPPASLEERTALLAYGELSVRAGVFPRLDVQLRLASVFAQTPELSVAYQLVGDPSRNDLAVTLGVGTTVAFERIAEPSAYRFDALIVPAQILVDVPVTVSSAVVVGGRLLWGADADGAALKHIWVPTATLGYEYDAGHIFFIRPELAASLVLETDRGPGVAVMGALAVGARLDLRPEAADP